jgi:hypothetical protein
VEGNMTQYHQNVYLQPDLSFSRSNNKATVYYEKKFFITKQL